MQLTYPELNGDVEIYMDCLEAITGDNRSSMIDLGCCHAPHTPKLGFKTRKYIDKNYRTLDHKEEQQYFKQEDVLNRIYNHYYSVSFAMDFIEHLTEKNGHKLLDIMDNISVRQVLFTPLTDLFGMDYETENPESHRSLWTPDMIESAYPGKYAFIIFPNYHAVWNGGAFFFFHCSNIEQDFERVKNILSTKQWAK